ncbi:MAG: TrkA C-terminal domain-containing protein [Fusobacterium sp.]|nr:TrkA C-terminal domain-containing protein [Fusobacterium sp.]
MEIVGSLVLFMVFIFVYLIIVEVFVMLFRITGLTDEKARFQVISMLTNSGYTTREAELIINSKTRRKLARFVMIFGYAFTVTIVSAVVNIFLQFRNTFTGGAVAFIPLFIAILIILFFVKRNNWIKKILDKFIDKSAKNFLYHQDRNTIIIIDDYNYLVMAKIEINIIPKELKDVNLYNSNIKKKYGINVILKKTGSVEVLPDGDTTFASGDIIVVMGEEKKIREIFDIKKS